MAPLDAGIVPASAPPRFEVREKRMNGMRRWQVVRDGRAIMRTCWTFNAASMAADSYDRAARKALRASERACLSCGAAFESQGPHNRMCDHCRQTAGVGALF